MRERGREGEREEMKGPASPDGPEEVGREGGREEGGREGGR